MHTKGAQHGWFALQAKNSGEQALQVPPVHTLPEQHSFVFWQGLPAEWQAWQLPPMQLVLREQQSLLLWQAAAGGAQQSAVEDSSLEQHWEGFCAGLPRAMHS